MGKYKAIALWVVATSVAVIIASQLHGAYTLLGIPLGYAAGYGSYSVASFKGWI